MIVMLDNENADKELEHLAQLDRIDEQDLKLRTNQALYEYMLVNRGKQGRSRTGRAIIAEKHGITEHQLRYAEQLFDARMKKRAEG